MRNLIREYGEATYANNGRATILLPRDYAQVDILVELYASIITDIGTTAATYLDVAPAQLLKHIEIRANGRDVIKSLDFEGLVRLTHLRYGTEPNNTVLDATQDETVSHYLYGLIPFAMWRSVKPFDTLFNSKPLTTFEAILTWGTMADCFDAGETYDSTYSVNEAIVYLSGKEAVGLAPDAVLPVNKEATTESTVTATATEKKIQLNYAKDLQYRTLVLRTTLDYKVSNAMLNNIKLQSGGVIFFNLNARRDRARYKTIYGLESIPTGYYVIDFSEDGRLFDSLDTSGLSSLDLILDVTASADTDRIKVYTTEIITPTVAASA